MKQDFVQFYECTWGLYIYYNRVWFISSHESNNNDVYEKWEENLFKRVSHKTLREGWRLVSFLKWERYLVLLLLIMVQLSWLTVLVLSCSSFKNEKDLFFVRERDKNRLAISVLEKGDMSSFHVKGDRLHFRLLLLLRRRLLLLLLI